MEIQQPGPVVSTGASRAHSITPPADIEEGRSSDVVPESATSSPETWKNPRINLWRFLATLYCFIILGINDAAYGALIPYLEEFYGITYLVVSLVFLSPVVGYMTSASINNLLHVRLGQRGVGIIASSAHLVGYIIISQHPPYPVLVVACITTGFGNGLSDAAWNAWLGAMPNANEILGILHAFYGLGAMVAPTMATNLITQAQWPWYQFYYIISGLGFLEVLFLGSAFWGATGEKYRAMQPGAVSSGAESVQLRNLNESFKRMVGNSRTAEALKNRVTWVCALFLTMYVGAEVALGGWIVTFMLRVRHGSPFASGMTSTGFWAGITVGRVVLGFVTPRLFRSEKHAVTLYLVLSLALELMFWLIPQFYVSAVMVSLVGFFLGPLFPAAVVAATKLLPKSIHVSAIGFAAAVGSAGATVLPFAVGAIAQAKGVWVLQPVILAILVVSLGIWLFLPSLSKKKQ